MLNVPAWLEAATRRLGGTRVLALPLLRLLAVLVGVAWVAIAPPSSPSWTVAAWIVAAFAAYSAAVIALLWARPAAMLRRNVPVLAADLAFALALIAVTGGAASAVFLALLVIAAVQSYYYGIRFGIAVGAVAAAAYLVVVWPTLQGDEWANIVVRITTLLGTAVGIGILADLEDVERSKVSALSAAVQDRERFIGNVVERLQEGVVALDRDGRIVAWNEAMEGRHGLPAAAAVGRGFFEVLPQASDQAWGQAVRQLLRGEVEEFTFDGVETETFREARVVLNLKGSVLREAGRPAGAVLLVEDITERRALERSARQVEKLAGLGTLAAGVAHELNNPIGIITSRVELMLLDAESRPLPDDVRADLQVLHRHAQRVARIAHGLLSFARQSPHQRGPVDFNRLVEETLLLVQPSIRSAGVTVHSRLGETEPTVWGDANALQQVILNLLTNARDALGGTAGDITITTAAAGGRVRLTVHDTGPGIPPEALPRVFDPFFTTKPEGTGLGLSISYGIVRDHAGTVDVHSRPGHGTTFVLDFPEVGMEAST